MQSRLDFNLLVALDVLLEEESVTGAAARLHLSGPAMSRTLGRIRRALGDPVLVRSGRGMVPTPRALALRAEVRDVVRRAAGIFGPDERVDPGTLEASFTVQAEEGTIAVVAGPLLERLAREAPGVTLRFLGEGPRDTHRLRRDTVDLEVGVISATPETSTLPLLTERFVAVMRPGHPLTKPDAPLTAWAAASQLATSRRGRTRGPIDDALAAEGLRRRLVGSVPDAHTALAVVAGSDLVAFALARLHRRLIDRLGLVAVVPPLELPPCVLEMAWHVRYDADAAHAWLRGIVRDAVLDAAGVLPGGTISDIGERGER
ncbi:LysR family transcriptional regulator [Actinomadura rayongensis]|uniref:LysR family transcriptional regulator n=1 Tax=Actinomadura rayongensis TaxID=1429076 RepID=A0A6I4WEE0_9ACTN|nr:LysR family transcriptional regulator [Actinomadura rayongensis]MXQ68168.1 LysR family transcriptional regulator [Actinomadura rayongensis]